MSEIRYRPTASDTPNPALLDRLQDEHLRRWIPVTEALPPERIPVLVIVRGDNCPAFAWLKFAAGDRLCPRFICPQLAAMEPRGCAVSHDVPPHARLREDVTHWFAPMAEGMPWRPDGYRDAEWGLGGCGWETKDEPLNRRATRTIVELI